jgi:Leucine-rich repeat (LRR) protein
VRISDVVFNDPALQRCVAATAGVTYTRDLTRLDCPNAGLVQLTGLEQFKNLRSIDLSGNQVFDLTPLGQLVRLEFIDASENPITDLSVFGQLPVLQILNLRRIPGLQNVDLLSNLVPLLELYLDGTGSGLLDCRTLDALNARLDSFTPP